jgi:glycosyltransferase involved in cell wall biosynthesis
MTGPIVSVIIPVFNGERHIRHTIQSVLEQTYRPLEILVIDDGSTDGTARIVNGFAGQIRYFWHENRGSAASRNRGVAESRGEYIAFVDADDLWHREKIEKQIRYLKTHSTIELCVTHIENFWSEEVPMDQRPDTGRPDSMPGYSFSTLAGTRSGMERVGPLKERLRHADDTEWFLRAREKGIAVGVLSEILVRRRLHLSNDSRVMAKQSGNEYLDLVHDKIKQMKSSRKNRP